MRQVKTLTAGELKKLCKKRSVWLTLGILLGLVLFMDLSRLFGSEYIEGEAVESRARQLEIERENARRFSGRLIDDVLLEEIRQAFGGIDTTDPGYAKTRKYQESARLYKSVSLVLQRLSMGYFASEENMQKVDATGAAELYQARREYQRLFYDAYGMSPAEQSYWERQADRIKEPMVYEYADAWDALLGNDFYMVGLFLIFLSAICVSGVFTEEHSLRTDQLILCARYGRKELYFAKLLAGSLFCICGGFLLLAASVLCNFVVYGPDGFHAQIQLYIVQYGLPVSVGSMFGVGLMLLFFLSLLSGVLTMVLAEAVKKGIGTLAILIGATFLTRIILIPSGFRWLSQAWTYLPANLLHEESVFDLRLVSLPGIKLAFWQFAPIVYLMAAILLAWVGKRIYCRYQVGGR